MTSKRTSYKGFIIVKQDNKTYTIVDPILEIAYTDYPTYKAAKFDCDTLDNHRNYTKLKDIQSEVL